MVYGQRLSRLGYVLHRTFGMRHSFLQGLYRLLNYTIISSLEVNLLLYFLSLEENVNTDLKTDLKTDLW